jgi:hypothetical protein
MSLPCYLPTVSSQFAQACGLAPNLFSLVERQSCTSYAISAWNVCLVQGGSAVIMAP